SGSSASPAVPGAGNLSQLATDIAVAHWSAAERPKTELARKAEKEPQPPKEPPKPPRPAGKHEEIAMGGDGFNLQVVITLPDAGVQSVVLSHFKAADEMGRPVDSPLHLVPEDTLTPSFILRQAIDEQHAERPRDFEWTEVSRQTDPDSEKQEVVL